MKYCENCAMLTEYDRCRRCGSTALREPAPNDYCFLTERSMMWAEALRDLLEDNQIESVYRPVLGAGLSAQLGSALERYRVYVPLSRFEDARELCDDFFAQ